MGDYRGFYDAPKAVYGPSYRIRSPLQSVDGSEPLTDRECILNRWSEHFHTLFSAIGKVHEAAIDRIPQQPTETDLDKALTLQETVKAIDQLKSCKAAGIDGVPLEVWKNGDLALHTKLHEFFIYCWEEGKLPQDLHVAVIITLYKNKRVKSDCSNYRRITLLSIAGKIVARILLNRLLLAVTEEHLPRASAASEPIVVQQTRCLSSGRPRSPENKTRVCTSL